MDFNSTEPWRLGALMLLAALGLHAGSAQAQGFPSKPVRIVVPYAPGGTVDGLARIIAPRFGEALTQPVIVENRAGAGGMIGTASVAKGEPDGYTVLLTPNGLANAPALYRRLSFDPAND